MRAAATSRWRDILTARITALTFEKVNGIFARNSGYFSDDFLRRSGTLGGFLIGRAAKGLSNEQL
jgi:hypothetical protein